MKKFAAFVLAALMTAASFAGCARKDAETNGSDLAYLQDKGTMIVGITEYEPMDYRDENGEWIGFDAELARLVAEKLGVEAQFVILADWGQKYYELDTKNIDAIWNGMTITDEAKRNASVTDAYAMNAQVVIMNRDRVGDYPDTECMKDLKFAVEDGSAGESLLQGLKFTNIVALQDQASAIMEVAAGTADACVVDRMIANATTGAGKAYENLAIGIALSSEEFGIAFRKDSDITNRVNEIMEELKQDGSLQALSEKYGVALTE